MTDSQKTWLAQTTIAKTQEWSPSSVLLYTPSGAKPMKAMKTSYRLTKADSRPWELPSIVFVDAAARMTWAGRECDLYVETNDRILGIVNVPGGFLYWYESSLKKNNPGEGLDSAVKRYEERPQSMAELAEPPEAGETNLRDVLGVRFFSREPESMDPGRVALKGVSVGDGVLKLELNSPTNAFHARLSIDTSSKEVTRAVKNGKQVVPKAN